jgi:ABC-type nickel/cobalt efflux system permease component RcnA
MGYLNSLNGGIVIGIGLFLLLPESKQSFEEYFDSRHTNNEDEHSAWEEMPYAFFLSFFVYSFLLFSEKVLLSSSIKQPHIHDHEHHYDEVENDSDVEEEVLKNVVSTKGKFASFLQVRNSIKLLI